MTDFVKSEEPSPEFSRRVAVAELGPGDTILEIDADERERAALAERFALVSLDKLTARTRLTRSLGNGTVELHASFTAHVIQSCVVTLEPVETRIEERVDLTFSPDVPEGGDVVIEPLGKDPPEPLVGEFIDVGEVVAEHLALVLDPYPRLPGVSAAERLQDLVSDADRASKKRASSFARLREPKGSG